MRFVLFVLLLPFLLPWNVAIAASGELAPAPAISVNYPTWKGDRFVTLTLNGFPQRNLSVNNVGGGVELTGIRLDDFLARAGWSHIPQGQKAGYIVHVEDAHGEQASFALTEIETSPIDQRVWLVTDPLKPDRLRPEAELIVLNDQGAVKQKISPVRRIRVSRKENE
jgi:hypothetical protein